MNRDRHSEQRSLRLFRNVLACCVVSTVTSGSPSGEVEPIKRPSHLPRSQDSGTHASSIPKGPASTQFPDLYYLRLESGKKIRTPETLHLTQEQKERIVAFTQSVFLRRIGLAKDDPSDDSLDGIQCAPLHLSVRRRGGYLCDSISVDDDMATSLRRAIERAVRQRERYAEHNKKTLFPNDLKKTLRLRITLLYNERKISRRSDRDLRRQIQRGLHAVSLRTNSRFTFFAASKPIINNYSHGKFLRRLSESIGSQTDAYLKTSNRVCKYDTISLYCEQAGEPVQTLYRDDEVIPLSAVNFKTKDDLLNGMGEWLLGMLRKDGRMEYKYMPSRGSYSKANNMIRQWMATLAFAELFHSTGDDRYADAWRRNVSYNLENYYRKEQSLGHISYRDKSKLGSLGVGLLALSRGHDIESKKFNKQKEGLRQAIHHLWNDDGSFTTFLHPKGRNDNQSFYPGEALLALVATAGTEASEPLLKRIKLSMKYYMEYYRATRRYTPFVPWHTMAYWHAYERTGDAEYRSAIYEMNDWLINIQDLDEGSYPDLRGRFFKDEFSSNGPPHASSTAVYVEGLAYAYDLARQDSSQPGRAESYLRAIRHGIRRLMQLQYRDLNSYYLYYPKRVSGAIRTRVTDNQLRIDNTQHAVMAILAVKRFLQKDDLTRPLPSAQAFQDIAFARFRKQDGSDEQGEPSQSGQAILLFGGDTQLGRFTEAWGERHGLAYHLRGIDRDIRQSNALIVNLECVVSDRGEKVSKTGSKIWHLRASPHMLGVFPKNRTTVVSIANNHSMDYGSDALMDMVNQHLPRHGINFAGGGKNRSEAEKPSVFTINDVKIALFSLTTIQSKLQATENSAGYNWVSDNDVPAFKQRIRDLLDAHQADSDIQILSIHWGPNHTPKPPETHQPMARAAIDLGIDLVIGHSAHVNHGIEVYKGVPIFYDLGNFLVDFKFQKWDDQSFMPRLTVRKSGVSRIELIPINLHEKAVKPAIGVEATAILSRIQTLSQEYGTRISVSQGRGYLVPSKKPSN